MKDFSNSDCLASAAVTPGNQAARLQALAEEYETGLLVGRLDKIYQFADSLADPRYKCRSCANCCNQSIRPLAAYAVEIAYLTGKTAAKEMPMVDEDEPSCPALAVDQKTGRGGRCKFYLNRPLGCRLFLPYKDWAEDKGCANYPHSPDSLKTIHYLLNVVEGLNQEFVRTIGLHRDFDFDYLAHWSITAWFTPISAAATAGPNWGVF